MHNKKLLQVAFGGCQSASRKGANSFSLPQFPPSHPLKSVPSSNFPTRPSRSRRTSRTSSPPWKARGATSCSHSVTEHRPSSAPGETKPLTAAASPPWLTNPWASLLWDWKQVQKHSRDTKELSHSSATSFQPRVPERGRQVLASKNTAHEFLKTVILAPSHSRVTFLQTPGQKCVGFVRMNRNQRGEKVLNCCH